MPGRKAPRYMWPPPLKNRDVASMNVRAASSSPHPVICVTFNGRTRRPVLATP